MTDPISHLDFSFLVPTVQLAYKAFILSNILIKNRQ
jgi:hypothetical protein